MKQTKPKKQTKYNTRDGATQQCDPVLFLWLFCVKVYLDFYIEYNRHTKHNAYSLYLDIPLYL